MTNSTRTKSGLQAIKNLDEKVREALASIEPNPETKDALVDYYLQMAAAVMRRSGRDLTAFIERAQSSYARIEATTLEREASAATKGGSN